MTDSQPKFKFKKRSKTSKKNLRKTTDDDTTNAAKNNNVDEGTNIKKIEDDNNGTPPSVEVEEEEPSALNTILAVERRRKLLDKRNRGVDTATLGKHTTTKHLATTSTNNTESETTANNNTQNKDFDQRLQMSFAGGKLAGSNDMGGDDEGGILAKKHRLAMEDYIKQNLNEKDSTDTNNNNSGEEKGGGGTINATTEAEKEMYAELLVKDETDTIGIDKEGEGDVGAGGAMMGGTGIAEVALPIDERIKALKETERVAMEIERARKARFGGGMGEVGGPNVHSSNDETSGHKQKNMNSSSLSAMVPMNFTSGPGKRKRQEDVGLIGGIAESSSQQQSTNKSQSTTTNIGPAYNVESSAIPASAGYSASSAGSHVQNSDVSTLGASYSHNFKLHTKEWVSRKRDERQSEIEAVQAQQVIDEGPTTAENEKRVGFEQSRKIAKGEVVAQPAGSGGTAGGGRNEWDKKQGGGNQPSSDERVWRNFMSKQRNRR